MSYFSQKIKSLREAYNYTQAEVAKNIGISQGNYSGLESGKNNPSLTTLQRLSDFYSELIDTLVQPARYIDTEDSLPTEEKVLLNKFRRLPYDDQIEATTIIDMKLELRARINLNLN